MKRVPPKTKKKSKAKKSAAIRSSRGKYKHLGLMKELKKSRAKDRQRERARAGRSKRMRVRESSPVYGATQRDLFETENRNGERLGYSPAYAQPAFTNFRGVTPSMDLAELNLNWREVDLPEKERTKHVHRLHPYLGKFIPQLVEIFLRKFRPKTVCDPFAGSGTILVEAKALGIDAIGCDVSAFNCLLMKVKTDTYDVRKLELDEQQKLRFEALRQYTGTIIWGKEGNEYYKTMDAVLPKSRGLAIEFLIYLYLIHRRFGFVVPLLLHQRLITSTGAIAPPDFLVLKNDGRVFGVEVGYWKEGQSNEFVTATSLPTISAELDHDQPFRCPKCQQWITYCNQVIESYSRGISSPNPLVCSECKYFDGCKCPDIIFFGEVPEVESGDRRYASSMRGRRTVS
jgi:DNA methylase